MTTQHVGEARAYTILERTVIVRALDAETPDFSRLDDLLLEFTHAPAGDTYAATFGVRHLHERLLWRFDPDTGTMAPLNGDRLMRELEWRAFDAAIRQSTLPLILHAGAVVRDGLALLLPAASGAGKTTLTLALAARGWLPLTDDVCPLIEQAGAWRAMRCPRCCHLSDESRDLLRGQGIELEGPVGELYGYYRPRRWGEPAPVRAIAIPCFQAGAAPGREPLTQAQCLAELIPATYAREWQTGREQRLTAARLAGQVPGVRLMFSSVEDALDLVEALAAEIAWSAAPTMVAS